MAGTLTVQNIQGPTSGDNANKIIVPSGHTFDASGGTLVPSAGQVVQTVKSSKVTAAIDTTTTTKAEISSSYRVSLTPKFDNSVLFLTYQAGFNVGDNTRMGIDFMVGTNSDYSSMVRIDATSVDETVRTAGATVTTKRLAMMQYYTVDSTATRYFTMYFNRPMGSGGARVNDNTGASFLIVQEIAQ